MEVMAFYVGAFYAGFFGALLAFDLLSLLARYGMPTLRRACAAPRLVTPPAGRRVQRSV